MQMLYRTSYGDMTSSDILTTDPHNDIKSDLPYDGDTEIHIQPDSNKISVYSSSFNQPDIHDPAMQEEA